MEENKNIEPEQPPENIPEELIPSQEKILPEIEVATPQQPAENISKEIIAVDETVVPESEAATVVKQIEQSEIPITIGTIHPKLQSEKMEVHHHGHVHEKKKWLEYLFQFLMLFLAVFCGFLAEYQLEHKIESDRAEELAKSFYQELKKDSITAALKSKNRIKQENSLDYLIKYFKDSSLDKVSKTFAVSYEYGIDFRSPSIFEPRKIILEQLKNSGSLRYFKDDSLQALIGDLTVAINNIYDRQELEFKFRFAYIDPLIMQMADYDFDKKLRENNENIFEAIQDFERGDLNVPFFVNQPEKIDRNKVVRLLNVYRTNTLSSTRISFIGKYMEINAALLDRIRQKYYLQD